MTQRKPNPITVRKYCLNADVGVHLSVDVALFVVWRLTCRPYDADIDPLHNPDWVEARKKQEKQLFDQMVAAAAETHLAVTGAVT